jgi:rod shape-determining protein MreC
MANGTWKIARGRGSAQLPLAIVAVLAIVLVLLGKAQSTLFDRIRAYFSDATAPALEWVRAPLNGASRWLSDIDDIFVVYQENLRLKDENARLRQWQNAALALDERLKRYQLLLNAVPDPALTSITARVIGRATRPFLDTMILDAGKHDGVKPGEAVVDPRGMIGRIFLTGQHTSWVILLTDLNSHIPVTIKPGNVQAIMAGDNTPAPVLETLASNTPLKEGDQVTTSGDGGLLPPGLPVGVLVADGGKFRVALLADPSTSEDVRVLDFKQPPEQPPAPSPNDLPAAAAGLTPRAPAGIPPNPQANAGIAPKPVPTKPFAATGNALPPASAPTPSGAAPAPASGDAFGNPGDTGD